MNWTWIRGGQGAPLSTLGREVLARLRRDWLLGLLALTLSLGLWVFVTNEENPPQIGTLPGAVAVSPVNVPAGLDLLGRIDPVRVRLLAPRDLWASLNEGEFEAVVDLSGLSAGTQEVPVRVEAKDARVRITEIIPSRIKVELAVLKEQVIPVKVNLQGSPPLGYEAKAPTSDPTEVTVRGPEPLVNLVEAAVADVNLDGAKVEVSRSHRLIPRTISGYEIEGVVLEPASAIVQVSIEQQVQFRSLVVSPVLTGQVAPGYRVVAVNVEPVNVTVVGPPQALQDIDYLETKPVELNSVDSSFSLLVGLKLPAGLSLVVQKRVTVSVTIGPLAASGGGP